MMQFTREEFTAYYWKVKKVSFNSLSGAIGIISPYGSFSTPFTANSLPSAIDATNAATETDLVCYKGGNDIEITTTSPTFYSGHGAAFAYRNEIGDTYYIQPKFVGGEGNSQIGRVFYTSSRIIPNSGGWYIAPLLQNRYDMGQVGTFTMAFSFGTKTCPIYGYAYDFFDDPENPTNPNYTPTGACNLAASQTATWPYNP